LNVLSVIEALPERTFFLLSTKIGGKVGTGNAAHRTLLSASQEFGPRSIGFAEVLVQHAENNQKNVVTKGLSNMTLGSPEIQRTFSLVLKHGKPLIVHIETQDFATLKDQTLNDLERLLQQVAPIPVILMHMAQLPATDVQRLIDRHRNVYFFTSTADPLNQKGIERRARQGEIGQVGWIDMFDVFADWGVKNPAPLYSRSVWKSEWKLLIEAHPDRFVFAIDSVYADPWKFKHAIKVAFWRRRLGELDPAVAQAVACENAKILWALDIRCQK